MTPATKPQVRITFAPLALTFTRPVSHTVAGHTFQTTTTRTWKLATRRGGAPQ